jgi:hypothetical protein
LSFGVFHLTHPGWFIERLAGNISGPPALTLLPRYVFHNYNVTHSPVVWAVAFFLFWRLMKKSPWLLLAWLLHILCDIPTHAASYFPTPFLWPFPTPFVDGVAWSTPWVHGGELRRYIYSLWLSLLLFPTETHLNPYSPALRELSPKCPD